ncbi:MAG: hypothetical protein QM667_01770 [Asticcacaulis sp.]
MTPPVPSICFCVTVDDGDSACAEAILRHARVLIGAREEVPRDHKRRLWVLTRAAACAVLIPALIAGLPAAEIGAFRPALPPHLA